MGIADHLMSWGYWLLLSLEALLAFSVMTPNVFCVVQLHRELAFFAAHLVYLSFKFWGGFTMKEWQDLKCTYMD